MESMTLTPLEKEIIRRSGDLHVTKRRMWQVVVIGLIALLALVWAASQTSIALVVIAAAVYMVITIAEKLTYGLAVLRYKVLIQKLTERVNELEQVVDEGAV